ncbi:MAG: hypothetical protein AB8G99_12835, partial [Planctomycetaceae bacterium]
IAPEIAAMKRYKKNRFDKDTAWMERVYRECRPAFDRFGYPDPMANSGPSSPETPNSDRVAAVGG